MSDWELRVSQREIEGGRLTLVQNSFLKTSDWSKLV